MKQSTDMTRPLILAIAAGLTGSLVNAVLASLGVSSAGASVPLFIGLSAIVGATHYWKTQKIRSVDDRNHSRDMPPRKPGVTEDHHLRVIQL